MKEFFDDIKSSIWKDDRLLGMQEIANQHQFKFVERERFGTQAHSLKRFRLFDGKRGKRFKGVLYKSGEQTSLRTRIYDYVYFGDSKNRVSTVFEFYLPQWTFSEVLLRPKGSLLKLKGLFGKSTVIFPELTEFHKRYHIRARLTENLKYELNEEFLDLLSEQKKIWVEINGNFIIFYHKQKPLKVSQIMEEYEFVQDLLQALVHGHSDEEYV